MEEACSKPIHNFFRTCMMVITMKKNQDKTCLSWVDVFGRYSSEAHTYIYIGLAIGDPTLISFYLSNPLKLSFLHRVSSKISIKIFGEVKIKRKNKNIKTLIKVRIMIHHFKVILRLIIFQHFFTKKSVWKFRKWYFYEQLDELYQSILKNPQKNIFASISICRHLINIIEAQTPREIIPRSNNTARKRPYTSKIQ
jgi:hypothetical protein